MKAYLQHHLNVLHIYCRLAPLLGRRLARNIAATWERTQQQAAEQAFDPGEEIPF